MNTALTNSMNAAHLDDFTFLGRDGKECEQFIRFMRRRAFKEGKSDDTKWMAQYASVCFDGDALRWFERLERDTQNDWGRLSRALFNQYPPKSVSDAPDRFVPVPAAAPPSSNNPRVTPSTWTTPSQPSLRSGGLLLGWKPFPSFPSFPSFPPFPLGFSISSGLSTWTGIIKVTAGHKTLYVSRRLRGGNHGFVTTTPYKQEALKVLVVKSPSTEYFALLALNYPIAGKIYLGLRPDSVTVSVGFHRFEFLKNDSVKGLQSIHTGMTRGNTLRDYCWEIQRASGLIVAAAGGPRKSIPARTDGDGDLYVAPTCEYPQGSQAIFRLE